MLLITSKCCNLQSLQFGQADQTFLHRIFGSKDNGKVKIVKTLNSKQVKPADET